MPQAASCCLCAGKDYSLVSDGNWLSTYSPGRDPCYLNLDDRAVVGPVLLLGERLIMPRIQECRCCGKAQGEHAPHKVAVWHMTSSGT